MISSERRPTSVAVFDMRRCAIFIIGSTRSSSESPFRGPISELQGDSSESLTTIYIYMERSFAQINANILYIALKLFFVITNKKIFLKFCYIDFFL